MAENQRLSGLLKAVRDAVIKDISGQFKPKNGSTELDAAGEPTGYVRRCCFWDDNATDLIDACHELYDMGFFEEPNGGE